MKKKYIKPSMLVAVLSKDMMQGVGITGSKMDGEDALIGDDQTWGDEEDEDWKNNK